MEFSGLTSIALFRGTGAVTAETWTVTLTNGHKILIPKGQSTDFASIPPIFQFMYPKFSKDYARAAVVHDYLYRGGVILEPTKGPYRPSRQLADRIFYWIALFDGTNVDRAIVMYLGLRLGGWFAWQKLDTPGDIKDMTEEKTPDRSKGEEFVPKVEEVTEEKKEEKPPPQVIRPMGIESEELIQGF